ncbi:MAG: sulfurtransferase TusA family protein [Myxococcales bacterium]|nr:sulfurtransferase TusA family protein [Myxococcales bacterium]
MLSNTSGKIIDLSHAVCPMTAVLALVALKDLKEADTVMIRLRGQDSAANVTETLQGHGYRVEAIKTGEESTTFAILMVGKH